MQLDNTLQQLGDELALDLLDSQRGKHLYATGRTARSVHTVVTRSSSRVTLQLRGSRVWKWIEEPGTGPARTLTPSRTMIEQLREWLQAKGLPYSPYAVAVNKLKYGTRVPNPHNPGGVVSDVLNRQRVTGLVKTYVRKEYVRDIRSQLFSNR